MYYTNDETLDSMIKGWTRIEMLLQLYERAIFTMEVASAAMKTNDSACVQTQTLAAQKLVLALHNGLKPDECEVAHSVAQLLGFIMLRIEEKNFAEAKRFLEKLHASFSQIKEEAIELETSGVIPPMADANVFEAMA